jgi:hypothetical protein
MARGVRARHDKEDDVAHVVLGVAAAVGRRIVGQQRDEVVAPITALPCVPQRDEHLQRHEHLRLLALTLRLLGPGREQVVGEPGQHAAVLEREVEQGRQHLAGQFDGDLVDEVEFLADRQFVEDRGGARADHRLELGQGPGGEHRRRRAALRLMSRRIQRNEAGPLLRALRRVASLRRLEQRDAAVFRRRRQARHVALTGHDVVKAGDRPVGAVFTRRRVVDRVLRAQPLEPRPQRVGGEVLDSVRLEVLERRRVGSGPRLIRPRRRHVAHCVPPYPLQRDRISCPGATTP